MKNNSGKGKVFLVGAGPGDPGLITMNGLACIKKSDVIIYDHLASSLLLRHADCGAELIYVGKKEGEHTFPQEEINKLIVDKARNGLIVTRLKGGDPFIFGRGGEEVEALVASNVEFNVVPGITSAIGASVYAGIPLTHRRYATDVTFVTGHEDPTKKSSTIDWSALGRGMGTLVFFMGVKNLASIVNRLRVNGRLDGTPVALVRWGTTTRQITVTGTLCTIVEKCKDVAMKAPAIIIVGEVVNLRKTMKWFENRPLRGKSIVVTRSRAQASNLVKRLSELGSDCVECPTIDVVPPMDWSSTDVAIDNMDRYEWLIFTSVNGVNFFFQRIFEGGKDVRVLGNVKIAAIGPATAGKLLEFGLRSDIMPEIYRAESVVDAFFSQNIIGKRICLPRAMEARAILPVGLSKMGAIVDEISVYRTVKSDVGSSALIDRLKAGTVDMVTFTSSSTVKNFKSMFPTEQLNLLLNGVDIASIGPITAETARELGFKVDIVAENYTIDGLCESILSYYS